MIRDKDLPADRKITKARSQLIMDDPFFGNIAMHLDIVEDTWGILPYNTLATNGERLLYSKEYIDSLDMVLMKTELVHEVLHVAFKHPLRRGKRDFDLWNKACDQVVDHVLAEAGYPLPDFVKLAPVYKGMAAEEVYRIMFDAQVKQPGGPPGSKSPQNPIQFPPKSSPPLPGQIPPPLPGQSPPPPGQIPPPLPGQALPKQPQKIPQVKGAHGLVVDPDHNPDDAKQAKLAEEKVDLMVETAAKTAGTLPGSLEQLVKKNKEHTQDYRDLLRDFLEESLQQNDYCWENPDRTYSFYNMFLPGPKFEPDLPDIVFVCDTSGSVGKKEKEVYANEISGVLEEFPCKITAIYCDTAVRHTQQLTSEDLPIELEIKGGGGTIFNPAFQYIKDHHLEPKAVMFFTDMCVYGKDYGKDPGCPVLWMNTNRNKDKEKVPFGKIIPLDLDKRG